MTAGEFSRLVRADTIGAQPRKLAYEASEEERRALAKRFGLAGIDRLEGEMILAGVESGIGVQGVVRAEVIQSCVVTGEPVEARIDERFDLLFRPRPAEADPDQEIELRDDELDIVYFDEAGIDVGEAMAETMALALDPYPRAPGAGDALRTAGVKSEEEAGPFGALAALRDRLKR
jgi:uncharacterized metal-binding protein YceD (DUF177 family)